MHRERPVFTGIGRKLVYCEADRLGGSRVQTQLGAARSDPRPHQVREVRELSAHQVLDIHSVPFIADQQVLIGSQRLDALGEASDELWRLTSRVWRAIACTKLSIFLAR
jgi:hypothetical protein